MSDSLSLHIQNGRVIDPAHGIDEVRDLFVAGGVIVIIAPRERRPLMPQVGSSLPV